MSSYTTIIHEIKKTLHKLLDKGFIMGCVYVVKSGFLGRKTEIPVTICRYNEEICKSLFNFFKKHIKVLEDLGREIESSLVYTIFTFDNNISTALARLGIDDEIYYIMLSTNKPEIDISIIVSELIALQMSIAFTKVEVETH